MAALQKEVVSGPRQLQGLNGGKELCHEENKQTQRPEQPIHPHVESLAQKKAEGIWGTQHGPAGKSWSLAARQKNGRGGIAFRFSAVSSTMDKVHEHRQPVSHGYAPNSALQWMYLLPRVVRHKNLSVFHVL